MGVWVAGLCIVEGGALLAVWLERLGLGGREMTTPGHSKNFVLRVVQPALIGLMDGSVSTLAPLRDGFCDEGPWDHVSGRSWRPRWERGSAWASRRDSQTMGRSPGAETRYCGSITGLATFVGGILHTLPFLIPHVSLALYLAFGVVGVELLAISFTAIDIWR